MNNDFASDLDAIEVRLGQLATSVGVLRRRFELAGLVPGRDSVEGRLKLHEAMAAVLRQRGNAWTRMRDLAEMINRQGLYVKGDGSPVESNQLHARANRPTYRGMFEKNGPMLRLREQPEAAASRRRDRDSM